MFSGELGAGVGGAGEAWVGDTVCFLHTVLEKGVHFFTSSSPGLHLECKQQKGKFKPAQA